VTAKQGFECVRGFRHVDSRTGEETFFEPGDAYPGTPPADYYTSADGPDGVGPLLVEKGSDAAPDTKAVPAATDTKEK